MTIVKEKGKANEKIIDGQQNTKLTDKRFRKLMLINLRILHKKNDQTFFIYQVRSERFSLYSL